MSIQIPSMLGPDSSRGRGQGARLLAAATLLALAEAKPVPPPGCDDRKLADFTPWVDADGDGCATYEQMEFWCARVSPGERIAARGAHPPISPTLAAAGAISTA